MSEVLWWREESWWERRSLPLFGFNLAPRQFLALGSTGLLGFLFSSILLRDSLFGRIGVLSFFLSIGFVFATKRVKMVPVELQLYYRFIRKQGPPEEPAAKAAGGVPADEEQREGATHNEDGYEAAGSPRQAVAWKVSSQ